MSLIKFRDRTESERGRVFWHRSDVDGVPFRGPAAPMLRDEEFEKHSQKVWDTHVRVLDVSNEDDRLELEDILDCAKNNWYTILCFEKEFIREERTWLVMVIYAAPYNELPPEIIGQIRSSQG